MVVMVIMVSALPFVLSERQHNTSFSTEQYGQRHHTIASLFYQTTTGFQVPVDSFIAVK
jgi:hypothetical protein